ncbi:MAG: ThuA domain-containing protein [Verrucomicrobiota bacterium]
MKNTCLWLRKRLKLALLYVLFSTNLLAAENVRVLLVVGGHGFEAQPFYQVFKDDPKLTFTVAAHTNATNKAHDLLRPEAARDYDVIVCYDMWQKISEEAKADLINLLKQGKGLVVMHHALASYQDWPEFARIVGGKYVLKKAGGPPTAQLSTYKHDVDFLVHVADPGHPITQGVADFKTHDETYGNFEVAAEVHPLLTTEEPTSSKTIAWCKQYEAARVVYLQLGHDHVAYANPSYRKLVSQAIQWAAKKN